MHIVIFIFDRIAEEAVIRDQARGWSPMLVTIKRGDFLRSRCALY
jgi:hypothetical protein